MLFKMAKLLCLHKMALPSPALQTISCRRQILHVSNPIASRLNLPKPVTENQPHFPKPHLVLSRCRKFPVSMLSSHTQSPDIKPYVDRPDGEPETLPANPKPPDFPDPLPLEVPTIPDVPPNLDPSWPTEVPHINPSPQPEIFPPARETTNPVSPPVEVPPREQQERNSSYVKTSRVRDPPVYPPGTPPPDITPPMPPYPPGPPQPPGPPDVPPIPWPDFPPFPDPRPPDPFPPFPTPPFVQNSPLMGICM